MSGGGQTVFDESSGAFGHAFTGLNKHDEIVHDRGDAAFEAVFVTAPSKINPGLGPIYNNSSCLNCHNNDGGGKAPMPGDPLTSLLLRISVPGSDEHGGALPVPGYGIQIQPYAIFGTQKETDVAITYNTQVFTFADGETVTLRSPVFTFNNSYAPIPSNMMVSARMALPNFGLGLLESVGDAKLLAMADESDANGDGISGRPNYVWDFVSNKTAIGRFGHKAEKSSLAAQVAFALNEDIGVTNKYSQSENCVGQSQYYDSGLHPELPDSLYEGLVFYMKTLQVPARRNVLSEQVKRGEQLFKQANCVGCHKQTLVTDVNVAFPQVSNQVIHPYTDLLLHNMGPGLADGRPSYTADGREWRTHPLWGLGLTNVVSGKAYYLHDGRATTILEAILWHGGEADNSKNFFVNLPKSDRDALIAFLQSL